MKEVVILSAARTPIGAFMGAFKDVPAPRLGAAAIREAVKRSGVPMDRIDECLMGNVLTAGVGQAPARQAAIFAELPKSVQCTTINKVCGSGLKAVMWGAQMLQAGDAEIIVAGGMESMSRAPYLLEKAREGYRMGNQKVIDSMIHDGLWDVYNNFHMGDAAELCAKEKQFTRLEQDRFATQSYKKALDAIQTGKFKDEIVSVEVDTGKTKVTVTTDEEPGKGKLEKFPDLRPAFQKEGTITAANASSINDGAAALVLTTSDVAQSLGVKPIARVLAQATFAQAPEWFTTAPIGAIKKVLKKANLKVSDIDLWEINEAFSVVGLACCKDLEIPESKINIHGGAVALGHPIGASGARILTTLIYGLRQENKKLGIATLCIGGGEGAALLVEAIR